MSDDSPDSSVIPNDSKMTTISIAEEDDEAVAIPFEDDDEELDYPTDDDDSDKSAVMIHDQLPSVEEVRNYMSMKKTLRNKGKIRNTLFRSFAAAVGIIVGVVAVSAWRSSKINESLGSVQNSAQESLDTSSTTSRYDDVVHFLFEEHQVSSLPSLYDSHSAAKRAALFLAEGDAYTQDFFDESGGLLRAGSDASKRQFIERYVLALLYYHTQHGVNGEHVGWTHRYGFLDAHNHCDWNENVTTPAGTIVKGVTCDPEGFVIGLDLSENHLVTHPTSHHSLPFELAHLTHLERLHLHKNNLGGFLPDLQPLRQNLVSIGLMDAGLKGTFPDWLGEMTQLTTLALSRNRFDASSSIPKSFAKLVRLRILGLDNTQLSGNIDPLKGLNALEGLYLQDNQLTGHIKGNLWSHLRELDLSNNMLDGTIPENLLHYPHLEVVDLHRNLFYGNFPEDIVAHNHLAYLDLSSNSFRGKFSDRIGYLANLRHLDVSFNLLTGDLPDTIRQLTNLVAFSASHNDFAEQPLLDYFTTLPDLQELALSHNHFVGTLPHFFGSLTNLRLLDLGSNQLSGSIPTWYGLMTSLHILALDTNELTGSLPKEITNLAHLKTLFLERNNLSGSAHAICASPMAQGLSHLVSDCHPGSGSSNEKAEVDCRCCTLCCHDGDANCNLDKVPWTISHDPKTHYGSIRSDYDHGVDQAAEGWVETTREEATSAAGILVQTEWTD